MNIPTQSAGTNRRFAPGRAASANGPGVTASGSGSCGCDNVCIGFCVQGHCQGVCA